MLKRILLYFTRYQTVPGLIRRSLVPGTVIFLVLLTTFILWFPFLFRFENWFGLRIENSNMEYVYKHYDGPLYIVPAKTFYDPAKIEKLNTDIKFPAKYFAAHFPLYPLLMKTVSPILGNLKAMIGVNLLFTVLLAMLFYYFLKIFKLSQKPLLLVFVFLMLPRFLVVRSIGAPESLFMFLTLLSIILFEKEKFLFAGIAGGLATMTKSPGMLLFAAYVLVLAEKYLKTRNFNWKWLSILMIPLGLLLVFIIYGIQYKDFFAYFHSGDNIHLAFPFSVFNFQKNWVGTAWLEDILFYFFLYLFTVIQFKDSKYRSLFYYSLVFFIATTFVQHRDISRYSLPLWPLACISFEKFFTSKKFLIALIILLPAIYMYGWNFMVYNIMPIGEWMPFL